MTKQAIGYVRVSTEQQAKEGLSLEAQRNSILEWCAYNGYQLINIYCDEGISGKTIKHRKQLEAALAAISKGMAFVTYSLTRLSRSTKDLLHIKDVIEDAQADLVFINEKIDTTTPSGNVVFTILGAIGEFERKTTSERTRHIKQYNKKLGKYNGGEVEYGYARNDSAMLERVEHEQELILRARALRTENKTLAFICRQLTAEGYKNRSGKPFQYMTVKRILREN